LCLALFTEPFAFAKLSINTWFNTPLKEEIVGSRDKGHKETKKQKKDARKGIQAINLDAPPPPVVEVVKRGKKDREEF